MSYGPTALAPAALTSRWSYTVPANRKADATLLSLSTLRATVAGAPAQAYGRLRLTPSGGSATSLCVAGTYANVADSGRALVAANSLELSAGDALDYYTVDLSTTGTIEFFGAAAIKEYDA